LFRQHYFSTFHRFLKKSLQIEKLRKNKAAVSKQFMERVMLLGFHGATTMTSDLETDVKATAKAGFKALEVWAEKVDTYLEKHSVDELKVLFENNGVVPMTFNSIEFIAFRGAEYPQIQARCHQLCELGQAIGCPAVVVVPSPTPDREMPWYEVVDEYVKVLRDLSDIASEYDMKLALEFLGFGWCTVRTPRATWEILQKIDRENVGMNIDCAHFYGGGGLLEELGAIDPLKIYAFHLDDIEDVPKEAITDAVRLFPGLGIIPLNDICKKLKAIGYDGACSVELFRPEYWEMDPNEVAQKARESAMNILSPYFTVE